MAKEPPDEPAPADRKATDGATQTPATAAFPVHEHIGRHLKTMFDEVVTQPVPDKLRELLDELERRTKK